MPDDYHAQLRALSDQMQKQRGEPALKSIVAMIDLAQANNDGDGVATFAKELIHAAWYREGRFDYEMLGFGRLKALYESDPRYVDLRGQVLWYYKWVAEHIAEYIDVSPEQIETTFVSMEKYFKDQEETLRPIYALRCRTAAMMGKTSQAELFYEQWQQAERGDSDDCPACQTQTTVQFLLDLGRPEEALEAAGPVLSGDQQCEEVPATTFSRLLLPLLLVGRADMALAMSSFVRRQVRKVKNLLGYLADHVVFLSLIGFLDPAKRLAFVMICSAEESLNSYDRFQAWRAAWMLLAQLQKHGQNLALLPRRVPIAAKGEPLPIADAIAFFEGRVREIAEAFDRRNGTDRFAQILAQTEQLLTIEPPSVDGGEDTVAL